jgi:hypothetical protein
MYSRTDDDSDTRDMGAEVGGELVFISLRTGGDFKGFINTAVSWIILAVADSLGMFIINRAESANQQLFKNKVKREEADVSQAVVDANIYVLHTNGGSSYTTRQTSMAFAGGSLTQADVDNLTDRFETYMDSNGKGVIP